jgi:magnesium transporter
MNPAIDLDELREAWWLLSREERVDGFRLLDTGTAADFFLDLDPPAQADLIGAIRPEEQRIWLRMLPPDDAVDLIQEFDEDEQPGLLALLDHATQRELSVLLAYEADEAGGLMSSRFARLRPDMTVDAAVSYLRRQAVAGTSFETIYYIYVLETDQRLAGIVSFRDLFTAAGSRRVSDVMLTDFVAIPDEMDQEEVARLFAEYDVIALPVVDDEGRMKGIVTVDDIVDVVDEEATEDAHKFGGLQALEEPYLRTDFLALIRKRAPWLVILFFGGMFTAFAVQRFEDTLAVLTFLMIFMPLIIASGGNSGSQASTLVIRAMAMDEVRLRDWMRVARREVATGLTLGALLGSIGFLLASVLFFFFPPTGTEMLGTGTILRIASTVAASLMGVVLFGSMTGSMLPFLLRRAGFDPASASAPLVATLVDVTGLMIYFTTATFLLRDLLAAAP